MRETITQGASTAVAPAQVEQAVRARPLIHALLFVLGFSVIFVALGMVMSGIGQLVFDLRNAAGPDWGCHRHPVRPGDDGPVRRSIEAVGPSGRFRRWRG